MKDLKLLQNAIQKNNRVVCEELQERYQAFLPSSLVTAEELASIHEEDAFSLILMPDDVPANLKPRKVLGDGKVNFCQQIRGKVVKHTFLDENYALKTKILFTKLGFAILTFN